MGAPYDSFVCEPGDPNTITESITAEFNARLPGDESYERDSLVSVEPIEGGNVTVIDLGGALPPQRALTLYFEAHDDLTASQWFAKLDSLVNQQGTLTYRAGAAVPAAVTAILKKVRRANWQYTDQQTVTADFVEIPATP